MFLVVIIGLLYKLHYTLVSTRYEAKAATEKEQRRIKNTKKHLTVKKSLVETAEVFFRGPGEAVKL